MSKWKGARGGYPRSEFKGPGLVEEVSIGGEGEVAVGGDGGKERPTVEDVRGVESVVQEGKKKSRGKRKRGGERWKYGPRTRRVGHSLKRQSLPPQMPGGRGGKWWRS